MRLRTNPVIVALGLLLAVGCGSAKQPSTVSPATTQAPAPATDREGYATRSVNILTLNHGDVVGIARKDLVDQVLFYGLANTPLSSGIVHPDDAEEVKASSFYQELTDEASALYANYFRTVATGNKLEIYHGLLRKALLDKGLIQPFGF